MLAGSVWNFVSARRVRKGGWVALAALLVWCGGQGIHVWADATAYTPVTGFTRFMPLYYPLKAKRRLAKLGWVDPVEVEKQRLLRRADAPESGQLQYPLQPMQCDATETFSRNVPNIAVVFIDAMRPDRISAETTPVIARFAAESLQFANHFSGGNSSRMGFFSFFYGLPSTYWQSFYDLQRAPVLMKQMELLDYEVKAFSSVGFGSPAQIDRTVFADTPADALQVPGDAFDGINDNAAITAMWEDWLASRKASSRPWFGLLYYDPGNYPAGQAETFPSEWSDLRKFEAGYRARLSEADKDMAKVLAAIERVSGDRETLVIVASDHGYEFDELGLGYRGHASNYSEWQLRSTLLMRWPGRAPEVFTHRSAHQDVPATLLQEVFGCTNSAKDFSSGGNLFARDSWDWMIAGSYTSYAIVEPNQLVISYPGGFIEMLGTDYRPDDSLQLNPAIMQDAMSEMRRFFR
jgi:membrane-anchored protein YejM (alkaline phosphatase superfamily)